jgi:hypothetical protein
MSNLLKLFLLALIINLTACSDNVPTTVSLYAASNASQKVSSQKKRLRLEVPSLMGWGNLSTIKMTLGDTIELEATLETPTGESIPNQLLYIASQQGNFFTENKLLTDNHGQATSLLVATSLGKDTVIVTTQGELTATLSILVNESYNESTEIPPLEDLPGVVSWNTLAKVTLENNKPVFAPEIGNLNGKHVKVQGFMMPLENTETQKHFILSMTPPSCFFCLPAGSESIIEIYANQGIEFSFAPIIVTGTLNVLKND